MQPFYHFSGNNKNVVHFCNAHFTCLQIFCELLRSEVMINLSVPQSLKKRMKNLYIFMYANSKLVIGTCKSRRPIWQLPTYENVQSAKMTQPNIGAM